MKTAHQTLTLRLSSMIKNHLFCKINQGTGVHAAHRVMAAPQSFHIDLRVSSDPVDVRNYPPFASHLRKKKGVWASKQTF